eukprot:3612029-Rhodomonas_salina.5
MVFFFLEAGLMSSIVLILPGRTKFRLIVRYNRDTQEPLCLDLFDAGGEHGTKVASSLRSCTSALWCPTTALGDVQH